MPSYTMEYDLYVFLHHSWSMICIILMSILILAYTNEYDFFNLLTERKVIQQIFKTCSEIFTTS